MPAIEKNNAIRLHRCEEIIKLLMNMQVEDLPVTISAAKIAAKLGYTQMEVRISLKHLIDLNRIEKTSNISSNSYRIINGTDPIWKVSPVAEELLRLLWAVDIVHGPNWKIGRTIRYSKEAIVIGWKQLRQAKMVFTPDNLRNRNGVYLLTAYGRREAARRENKK